MADVLFNVNADPGAIPKVQASAEEFLETNGCGMDTITAASLCIEELLVNTVSYGYDDPAGHMMTVRISLSDDGAGGRILEMVFDDDAREFNPLAKEPPDLDAALEDRPIGGLGIHLIKTLTDEAIYKREAGKNILTLRKRLPAASAV